MKKVLLFLMTLLPLFVSGQVKRTIHVATAGTLPTLISEEEKYEIEELTLSGELNGTDFKFIRDMAGVIDKVCKENYGEVEYWAEHIQTKGVLKSLDLAESRILNGGEVYGIEGGPTATCLPPEGYQTVLDCISSYLFARTKLETIILPNSITSFGECVFYNCNRLTSITIPNSVTSIGDNTFYGCDGLKSVTSLNPVPPSIIGTSLGSVYENAVLNVPQGSKEAYMNADFWKLFKTINAVGDINGDGIIDSADIKEIEKYIMGNPSPYFDVKKADINNDGVVNVADMVIIINRIKNNSDEDDKSANYLTFVAEESGTFKFSGTTGNDHISYSMDGGKTWNTLASGVDSPTVSAGNKIMWKGLFSPYSTAGIGKFSSTGIFDVEGNIMSLLYGDDFKDKTSLSGKDYVFDRLFSGCTRLTSAENLVLPAMTLANFCYRSMFHSCTSFKKAPKLPAKTMSDWCYGLMFEGCTSLTIAPSLPANKLGESCYSYMFNGCTSLTTAPSLPCTKLAWSCYNYMFSGCTSLKTAPDLPATTLVRNCYRGMFSGCTSLNYIKCLATSISAQNCTKDWVKGVASTGTFIKASYMTSWTTGNDGIPSGWTVYNE